MINPTWTVTTAGTLNMAVLRVTTQALQLISVIICMNTEYFIQPLKQFQIETFQ